MRRVVIQQQQSFLGDSAVQTTFQITVTAPPVDYRALLAEAEAQVAAQYRQNEPVSLSFDIAPNADR